MDGSGARIENRTGNTDGFANTTNGANGDFTIMNGKNLTTNAAFSNAGMLTVGTNSTLTIGVGGTGTMTNTGTMGGTGTIAGSVLNSGTLSPGLSPGTLNINGNYTQNSSGSLNIRSSARRPSTY